MSQGLCCALFCVLLIKRIILQPFPAGKGCTEYVSKLILRWLVWRTGAGKNLLAVGIDEAVDFILEGHSFNHVLDGRVLKSNNIGVGHVVPI